MGQKDVFCYKTALMEAPADTEMQTIDLGETVSFDSIAHIEAVTCEGETVAQTDHLIEATLLGHATPTLMTIDKHTDTQIDGEMAIDEIVTQTDTHYISIIF